MADTVVVGVDGSDPAQKALTWTADYARDRDAHLQVVTVYGPREAPNPHTLPEGGIAGAAQLEQQARLAAEWRDQQGRWTYEQAVARIDRMLKALEVEPPAHVERIALEGTRPSRVLINVAREADLLVVGSRGRGGFAGLVLGSVSQQLANHAPCPVVIVRAERKR